jgi:hypothetical protein
MRAEHAELAAKAAERVEHGKAWREAHAVPEPPDPGAIGDARYEHSRGHHCSADEARARAAVRRERGVDTADYWDAYADEIDRLEGER